MPLIAIVGPLMLIAALVVALVAFGQWRDRKIERIFADSRLPGARAHAKCMLRFYGLEGPGIALATNDELVLHPLVGRVRRIPLAQLTLRQETPGTGPYGWWDQRIFHLECPEERVLVLGVADPVPWRPLFPPRP